MSNTSLPPNAPMTNGTRAMVNGEADDVCALLHAQVSSFLSAASEDDVTKQTQEQTRKSMQVIEKALEDYEFSALSLSYNGGKDCLVLLILYLAVLHTHFAHPKNGSPRKRDFPKSIPSIYAKPPDPFPAVSEFVDYSSRLYHLDLTHISTNPGPRRKEKRHSSPPATQPSNTSPEKPTISFRDAFALYLSSNPSVKAIFVGTRRTDPHGSHLTNFDPTDHNWPPFMRIHPVIDWPLSQIWCFLRSPYLKDLGCLETTASNGAISSQDGHVHEKAAGCSALLKYCSMYDMGYTSLGGVNDTVKNPKLRYVDGDGRERYRPAYEMTWDEGERLGRE